MAMWWATDINLPIFLITWPVSSETLMCQSYYHPPRGEKVLSKTRWLAATVHCEHEPFLLFALASGNCLSWRLLALHWLQDRPTSRLTDMTATAYFRWVQIVPVPKQKLKEDFQTCIMLMGIQELYKYCIVGMWKGNTRTSLPEGVIFLIYCKRQRAEASNMPK